MAYQAWEHAKASIYETWLWSTDPRNLQPEVPKVMRDAAEFVRANPTIAIDQSASDRLYDTLNAPYAERVRRQIRAALNSDQSPTDKVIALSEIVERLALTPPPDPRPLPIIDESDIHLICWLAISPRGVSSDHASA
jgi:hypothetical protein